MKKLNIRAGLRTRNFRVGGYSCKVTLMGQTRLLVAKEDVESVRNSAEMVLESLEEAEDSAEE